MVKAALKALSTFLVVGFLTGCSSGLSGPMVLTGYVQSSKTDDNDNAVEAYIWDGSKQFHISKGPQLEGLLELIDRKVSVRGNVSTDWDDKYHIAVDSFTVLD